MAIFQNEDDTVRDATRLLNRAQRTLNKQLRGKLAQVQKETDAKIALLFETPLEAQAAFQELWGHGIFDCGPDDFDYMVAKIVEKFKQ